MDWLGRSTNGYFCDLRAEKEEEKKKREERVRVNTGNHSIGQTISINQRQPTNDK